MLTYWKRNRKIRGVLRGLARQRVALVLPGNVKVVEMALRRDDDDEAALATCMMRGWVEISEENAPVGDLTPEGALPPGALYTRSETQYRLTDSGRAALNRSHAWTLTNVAIAMLTLIATLATIVITRS